MVHTPPSWVVKFNKLPTTERDAIAVRLRRLADANEPTNSKKAFKEYLRLLKEEMQK